MECEKNLGITNETENLFQSEWFIPIHAFKAKNGKKPHDNPEVVVASKENVRYDLVSHILTEILPQKEGSPYKSSRYLILGGSGMGKSTFAAYFCYYYVKKLFRVKELPLSIYAYNLSGKKLNDIRTDINTGNISAPQKSILILDSIDENIDAVEDYSSFWKELNELTDGFRVVILTCRTQFFDAGHDSTSPNDYIAEPEKGCVKQAAGKYLTWERYYISPFTENEIDEYLISRFRFDVEKYRKACGFLERTNDIMSRPLMLKFIDYLFNVKWIDNEVTSAQIYNEIIIRWFEREIDIVENQFDINTLYAFTTSIAYYIHSQKRLVISLEEFSVFCEKFGITNKLNLDKKDKNSLHRRSLLNRTDDGYIKFSHKSFLEYFIAVHSLENPEVRYNPNSCSMAMEFARELYSLYLVDSAKFYDNFKYLKVGRSVGYFIQIGAIETVALLNEWEKHFESLSLEDKKNANLYFLYVFWEDLLTNILYQVDVLSFKKNGNREEVIQALCEFAKWLNSKLHIRSVQDVLIHTDVNRDINREKIIFFRKNFEQLVERAETKLVYGGANINNLIIFPTFRFNNEIDGKIAIIGNGFVSSDEIVLEKLKSVYESLSEGTCVCILKEAQNIDEQVKYINKVTKLITYEKSKKIIITFYCDDIRYNFLIDETSCHYSNDQIRIFLENLKAGASCVDCFPDEGHYYGESVNI